MKVLKERTEIAKAINGRKYPVVTIDLAKTDEYGIVSEPVVIDNGTFDDGFPYMIHSEIRCYSDEKNFTFSSGGVCISNSFGYYDVDEMTAYRNAPVIKPDEDVILVIKDTVNKKCWIIMLHTSKRINKFCSTPLRFEDNNDMFNSFMIEYARQFTKEKKYLGEGA